MKSTLLAAVSAASVATGAAHAGGLDRSGTPIDIIFEQGNRVELSFGHVMPEVSGTDLLGNPSGNVGNDFGVLGAAIKYQFNEKLAFALIFDQPYGADTAYSGNPATTLLGGTTAKAESNAITALLKYNVTDKISLYGGPRIVSARGAIGLSGGAYGPLNGYNVRFSSDEGYGYVIGGAYEIPDIAFRAALTYHSSVDLSFNTFEQPPGAPGFVGTGKTKSKLPQSIKLAVQSGVAPGTLVFGSVRWSEWSSLKLDPPSATPNLAELDDVITYEIGVGRKFTDRFSGSLSLTYEAGGSDSLVSPLAPTNGQTSVAIGGKYKISDNVDISGGIRYTWLGNAQPETGTPDVARANFRNNNAISMGLKLGINF